MRLKALIFFVLFLSICPAHAQERILDIQEVTSSKGIKAWLVEDRSLPIISIKFSFLGSGSVQDSKDKQGLARLASNTMDEGAGSYDSQQFQKALTDNNIALSFTVSRDNFGGNLKLLSKHKLLGFELLKLGLNEPRFDKDPLERMRQANLTRIKASLSNPEWKAARLLNDVAYSGHPYSLNSGGTLTTLTNISSEDLRNFVNTRLAKNNLRVGVAGDISAKELEDVLDDIFGSLPDTASLKKIDDINVQNTGETVLYEHDIPQTIIELKQDGVGRKHPDYYTAMVTNFILGGSGFGSRLTEEIREKRGLTYGIGSYFSDLDHIQSFAISTSTKNESVQEMMSLINAEVNKIKDAPVSNDELKNAKSYLIGSFPLSLSSTDNIASILLSLQSDDLPSDYLDKRSSRIDSVTIEQIQSFASKTFSTDKFAIVMVGKPQNIKPTKIVDLLPNVE